MKFSAELTAATLIKRYKRFLCDVDVNGVKMTVHCPNTGSMTNCIVPGSPCWLFDSENPKRKYQYSWELATTPTGHLAGINSVRANTLVSEAIQSGVVKEFQTYDELRAEVKVGDSRIDFELIQEGQRCFIEVKSVTLGYEDGSGAFPDAKSERAVKHLNELIRLKSEGYRSVLFFCVQHAGINSVSPADEIYPLYGERLREAKAQGVEVIAYRTKITPQEIVITESVPVIL